MKDLYKRWSAAFAAEPDMPLDGWRAMIAEWPQITAEPGGVDYSELDADGVPATWIAPKGAAKYRSSSRFKSTDLDQWPGTRSPWRTGATPTPFLARPASGDL